MKKILARWAAGRRPVLSTEAIALLASLYFVVISNRLFWTVAMGDRSPRSGAYWQFGALLLAALVCLHLCLLCLVLTRLTARPLLAVLFVTTALATWSMQAFGIYLTPGMMRNVLHTETKEAMDLAGWQLLGQVLLEGLAPALLVCFVRVRKVGWRAAAARRAATFGLSLCVLLSAVMLGYQDLATLFRNHKEARYLITPANYLYSLTRVLETDTTATGGTLMAVGTDAHPGPGWAARRKPVLFVIVVGETARAANWGLNGYVRQTTPELAGLDVINFPHVTACGSDTETSLPCMFSAVGRRDYDEGRIRGSESLLHVLRRSGFEILWRDNQTGCKGVCTGLPYEQVDRLHPDTCQPGQCLDGLLLDGLQPFLQPVRDKVLVLHQLGNHGPAYHHRYPDGFRRFTPTCDTGEIRKCSIEEIVNSYDNALLYTDHFLAQAIALLKSQEQAYDTALLYVSDHGESLGEKGLFLHGIPYAIAPDVQTRVPMALWLSRGFRESTGLNGRCIDSQRHRQLSHDYLFHTVLGLLEVDTSVRDHRYDLTDGCRLHPEAFGHSGALRPAT